MIKYLWTAGLAAALALTGIGVQQASAQHGYGGHRQHGGQHASHGHHSNHGHNNHGHSNHRHHSSHGHHSGHGHSYGRLPVYRSGYGSYPGLGYSGYGISRSSYYSGGSFPSTLGPYGGLGGYGNYGYLSHQPALPRVQPRVQLRIGF